MSIEPTTTIEYIWFGTRAVKFESGANTGPQLEVLDQSTDFATRTVTSGTVDFTGTEWQQFLAFSGTADEMAALGVNVLDGSVDTALSGQVNTTGDLRVGEGVEAYNIADVGGGGRIVDTTGTLDEADDPIAITGLGKAGANTLDSASIDAADTGNRVIFSNDIGFGFLGGSGFETSGNAVRINDGESINFEIKQGKVLLQASFTVKVLGGVGASTEIVIDSDGATIKDTNAGLQGGFVQDASAGELSLGVLDHLTKVTINFTNQTIWFNGSQQFLEDTSGFFTAFVDGGSKNLTLGSVVGNQIGWSVDDLVLATDFAPPTNTPAVIGGDTTGDVQEDTPALASASGQLTIDDADGPAQEVFVAQMATEGLYGTFSVDTDGSWTYLIDNTLLTTQGLITGQTEQEVFTVVSADGTEVDVTIDVAGLDEPPPAATLPPAFTGTGDATDDDGPGATSVVDFDPNGSGSANVVTGTTSADTVNANNNNDTVYGYDGDDRLNGENGNDQLYGQVGADTLTGGINDDRLFGGSGADSILGNDGADTLTGGFGSDTLIGGNGTDRFRFVSLNDTNDIITDFDSAEVLDFSAIGGLSLLATESASFTANNQIAWYQSGGDTIVIVNTDGNNATAEFMVTLQGYTTDMVLNDFVL